MNKEEKERKSKDEEKERERRGATTKEKKKRDTGKHLSPEGPYISRRGTMSQLIRGLTSATNIFVLFIRMNHGSSCSLYCFFTNNSSTGGKHHTGPEIKIQTNGIHSSRHTPTAQADNQLRTGQHSSYCNQDLVTFVQMIERASDLSHESVT